MILSKHLQTSEPQRGKDSIKSSILSLLLLNTFMHFISSPPVFRVLVSQTFRLPKSRKTSPQRYQLLKRQARRVRSPITSSTRIKANFLVACQSREEVEKKDLDSTLMYFFPKKEDNNIFLNQLSSDDRSLSKNNLENNDTKSCNNVRDEIRQDVRTLSEISNKLAVRLDSEAIVKGRNKLI